MRKEGDESAESMILAGLFCHSGTGWTQAQNHKKHFFTDTTPSALYTIGGEGVQGSTGVGRTELLLLHTAPHTHCRSACFSWETFLLAHTALKMPHSLTGSRKQSVFYLPCPVGPKCSCSSADWYKMEGACNPSVGLVTLASCSLQDPICFFSCF